jgi:pimeloyl-ACP methyl ester carboxylesterase
MSHPMLLSAPPETSAITRLPASALQVGAAVATVAERLRLPFAGDARALVRRNEVRQHPIWREPPFDAQGLPVLLVGGMLTAPPVMLSVLQDWLRQLGCRPVIAPTRLGVSCGEDGARSVSAWLEKLADSTGERPAIIAYSRGGQFARAAAVRRPELVRSLITLGSPLARLTGVHPLLRMEIYALGLAGTLGVPGLFSVGCLWGSCCRELRAQIAGPFPSSIPFLSIYSRRDEMVDYRSCQDPASRQFEVQTTHGGLVADPTVFAVIAAELRAVLAGTVGAHDTGTTAVA